MKTWQFGFLIGGALALSACSTLMAPAPDQLAALPVVSYPDKPAPGGDYVYRLPAGQPIGLRVRAEGSAFAEGADQLVQARLAKDIYLYKRWASDDGKTWQDGRKLVDLHLNLTLPSWETPGPGEILLKVDRPVQP